MARTVGLIIETETKTVVKDAPQPKKAAAAPKETAKKSAAK